ALCAHSRSNRPGRFCTARAAMAIMAAAAAATRRKRRCMTRSCRKASGDASPFPLPLALILWGGGPGRQKDFRLDELTGTGAVGLSLLEAQPLKSRGRAGVVRGESARVLQVHLRLLEAPELEKHLAEAELKLNVGRRAGDPLAQGL